MRIVQEIVDSLTDSRAAFSKTYSTFNTPIYRLIQTVEVSQIVDSSTDNHAVFFQNKKNTHTQYHSIPYIQKNNRCKKLEKSSVVSPVAESYIYFFFKDSSPIFFVPRVFNRK